MSGQARCFVSSLPINSSFRMPVSFQLARRYKKLLPEGGEWRMEDGEWRRGVLEKSEIEEKIFVDRPKSLYICHSPSPNDSHRTIINPTISLSSIAEKMASSNPISSNSFEPKYATTLSKQLPRCYVLWAMC